MLCLAPRLLEALRLIHWARVCKVFDMGALGGGPPLTWALLAVFVGFAQ